MNNTYNLSIKEVEEAVKEFVYQKTGIIQPYNGGMIGFLDQHDKPVDVNMVQYFYEIE